MNPLREVERCVCCGTCEYAIRAEPCWQELDKNCNTLIAPLWLCVESKCEGAKLTFGQIKTPVVFQYGGRCYGTIPGSVTLVSKLSTEIQEELITDTSLECEEEGCTSEECDAPENNCACLCRSVDIEGKSDCCMSRWDLSDGPAPWTFTYRRTIVSEVARTLFGAADAPTGCVDADCIESRACVFFEYEEEIDQDELDAEYDPIIEQSCTKAVPIRSRVTTQKTGLQPPAPVSYACCGEPNSAAGTWNPAGVLSVPPPSTIPLQTTDDDTGPFDVNGDCYSRIRTRTELEGDCTFYRYVVTEEIWTQGGYSAGGCCQEYQKRVDTIEYTFTPASDEMTLRLCAQCAYVENL
jgi:hypothetical protein